MHASQISVIVIPTSAHLLRLRFHSIHTTGVQFSSIGHKKSAKEK